MLNNKKYNIGLAVMRVQPFHNGHKFLIDNMFDHALAVIAIGSAQEQNNLLRS